MKKDKRETCIICDKKLLTQKTCCNVICQAKWAKIVQNNKNPRIPIFCSVCGNEFFAIKSQVQREKPRKICSKKCSNVNLETAYLGENNPIAGRIASDAERAMRKDLSRELYHKNNIGEAMKTGTQKFLDENGFHPSQTQEAKDKKAQTNTDRYGVPHNWSNKESREKCEITCIEKYGKNSWELGRQNMSSKDTRIEIAIENILAKNNISYIKSFNIFYKNIEDQTRCKIFDFFLKNYNLLIEADGDYWHSNPLFFTQLNETQQNNKNNDLFKNKLAKDNGYNLIRFWENDILTLSFENKLLEQIGMYEKI